ncbi:hypothetical protein CFC21_055961 [Triticum aestivum]|uniref:Uncharacterized protein n=2 Tax=Triticum aestivum TaxID=4565 RepID=A0A3B6UAB0_WHEAT|nr:disease resistance protein RGA2-like [Triticum aestivum]XP_044367732.1 disease resistance protein RGA2-like [Triticum aestivum]KAF7046980.1 hypothetical protein CFC21_055961 [Triticum aestivum]
MAGVLDALASYMTSMLSEMAKEEVAMLIGVSDGIKDLSIKLGDLKNFLADADRRNITDESVRGWVGELKRAMYLATDIVDLCQLKAMEQGQTKDRGCLNPLLVCMRNPLHAHDIGTRIKMLNQNLDDICKRGSSFNFIKLEAYQDRKMTGYHATGRKTDSLMERSGAVGDKIEEDTRALVEVLTREAASDKRDRFMVVAIVGAGGIGKTTLSKKVFNDDSIKGKFTKNIWLSITQDFNDIELLNKAIIAVGGDLPGGGGARDRDLLVGALNNAIRDKKFFLVLDDMWGVDAWDKLLMAPFSYGGPGSRVLITTRHDTVALCMKVVHYHHVDKLGAKDAWSLLKKQVVTTEKDEPEIEILKDIGLQIIEKCDGLPLAVKVVGGLLCQREKNQRAWQKVLNDDLWSVSQMSEELNYAICLSYEDLPSCLRQCFLHFSHIPIVLPSDVIVGMWISEGFVHGNPDGLEELGHQYYRQLTLRNLIEPVPYGIGQYLCNMHDVVRSFAQFVARDDALILHKGENINIKPSLQGFLRLSIETKGIESDEPEWRSLQKHKSLRSLMLIGNFKIQSGDSLETFSSLRMLHIESTKFDVLVESLYQLKHLRYLALIKCNDLDRLPENIHKMKFLQHISLEDCESVVKLPNSIVRLHELRHLDLDGTRVNSIPRGFGALYGFTAHVDGDWCSLEELGPLFNLRSIGLVNLQNVSDASFATKVKLGEKVSLSQLILNCTGRLGINEFTKDSVSEKDQGMVEEVFDGLYPPPCIEDIRIYNYFGRQLPKWMMSATVMRMPLNSLKILVMWDMAYCTQLPDGLCALPCLEYLDVGQAPIIKRVRSEFVQPYSHCHHASSQVAVSFARLHKMILWEMAELEEWEWEKEVQSMQALEELKIRSCKLRSIPPGLASHAKSLKKLTICNVQQLQYIENSASVVELSLAGLPDLTRISNFPKLRKLEIYCCPKLELLQEMVALQKLAVQYSEKQLPSYLQTVKPSHLLLDCCSVILLSMALGESCSEWDKFSHIQQVEAYADDGGIEKRWHLFYTREPYNMETNIDLREWSDDVNFIQSEGEDGLPRLAALMKSVDEDEEDADNTEEIEEESMGQGREE